MRISYRTSDEEVPMNVFMDLMVEKYADLMSKKRIKRDDGHDLIDFLSEYFDEIRDSYDSLTDKKKIRLLRGIHELVSRVFDREVGESMREYTERQIETMSRKYSDWFDLIEVNGALPGLGDVNGESRQDPYKREEKEAA